MQARYPGHCHDCGNAIVVGQEITRSTRTGRYVHTRKLHAAIALHQQMARDAAWFAAHRSRQVAEAIAEADAVYADKVADHATINAS